jgi:hypothetical protein
MIGIGHNRPKTTSVTSLSESDKKRVKGAIKEMNDSMTRAAAEKEHQKNTINDICDSLNLDKKLIRKVSKVYFKANFKDEVESHEEFEEFYDNLLNVKGV